ncbi:ABC transporter substrate-binding protein [Streptomyces aureoverticillatus]|uniref:ABC transporter substrate-binding protein n=1 Tax=Streptomyces aureoverticillatus TaxID=66871 RepID=UPI0013DA412D|nr:sugar ABC transporter substrate-binding protein [Streptomyces aureoverticillatus]QIB47872.1 sugar ABC transporter substrate-binding protein [Streptomyces aureoverticillatus]
MPLHTRRALRGLAVVCALTLGAAACGSSDDGESPKNVSGKDIDAALKRGGKITVWAWEPTLKKVAEDFEEKHPGVEVDLVNAGTNDKQYTALQNAMSAGKGVPDVAQIEYYALGQFALKESITDLSGFGAAKLAGSYSRGPWSAVNQGGDKTYALPMDSGPMALFYNKKLFDKHNIAVPTTWDEYVDAARALHKADPKVYITNDTGDAGLTTSLLWQAGSRPFDVKDKTDVGISFKDKGAAAYTGTWQKLIDDKLLAPITSWSDEWYQGMAKGTIATLAIGAWMPANLASGVKSGAGDWRVAPLPQWTKGGKASAENGGSSLALPTAGKNKELAYAFIEYANHGAGVQTRIKNGAFPATNTDLTSDKFQQTKFPYFGGQKANQVFAESAARVPDDWKYLPFQVYSNSVFNDTAGKAYVSDTPLADGLKSWQRKSAEYGKQQGFTVHE